jgi:hypothetical protein
LSPAEIRTVVADRRSLAREAGGRHILTEGERALLELRDLLVEFLEATGGESMRAMSQDQLSLFNRLCVAVEV